jgi:hypothetical protein
MKTICIFVKYQDNESWTRDTKKGILKEGKFVWESYEIMSSGTAIWDEIIIVEYSDEKKCNQALEDLKRETKIKKYEVYLIESYPKEQVEKVDKMMKKARDDPSIDISPGGTVDEVLPYNKNPSLNEYLKDIFNGEYQGDIVTVNFNKYPKVSVYHDGHKAEGEVGKETYKTYGRAAMQTQGKVGAHYDVAGKVKATLVSDNPVEYDAYVFVHFPSVAAFKQFYLAKHRWPNVQHQQASLEKPLGFIAKVYK